MRQDAAEAESAGADALDQGALRHELHLQFAGHHLPLGFWIETDMADDGLAQQLGRDELADPPAGRCRVIGDDGEVALVLTHDLVDDPLGRADSHEAADHQACAIRDHGNGLFERDSLHVSSTQGVQLMRFMKQSVVVQRPR